MGKHVLEPSPVLPGFDAVLFDLDGVLTPTASIHRRAWAALFTDYFRAHGITPEYTDADYYEHIDGKPRFEAVADLLASRGVFLPRGRASDPPGDTTVSALGNAKNQAFNTILSTDTIHPYPGTGTVLDALERAGKSVAVVSSSANAVQVLGAVALADRFALIVDGVVAEAEGLPGKPAPDTYLFAARVLSATPDRAVVVEDAVAGVQAGRAGGFGLVVGVDRGTGAQALRDAGADMVITTLTQLLNPLPLKS